MDTSPSREPIPYVERSRSYYLAQGYDNPYNWAQHDEVPFTRLSKPLSQARLGLVTTASIYRPDLADQGPGAPYNAEAKFYRVYSLPSSERPDLRISHVGYDRVHTHADDLDAYFPLAHLQQFQREGRIGSLTPRFHGAPTNRSQRTTVEQDAPEILARLREDGAEAAVLVPI